MNHLKLVVLGPTECGKSYLCNFLSEAVEQVTGDYRPTAGVRIIEYEQNIKQKSKTSKVEIEIWDVSGDKKYESCWPAILKGCNGVVFVYNPDRSDHEKDLNDWQQVLSQNLNLKDSQFCVVSYRKPNSSDKDICCLRMFGFTIRLRFLIATPFHRYRLLKGSIADDGENLREQFSKFVNQLLSSNQEANEMDELNIINA